MLNLNELKNNPVAFLKNRTVTSAYVDSTGRMGIAHTALMVQDNITENFGAMGCDNFLINARNAYWVITKTKIHFAKRPFWRDKILTVSYPISNVLIRANENTAITTPEGDVLVTANQEVCCLDLKTHRPLKLSTMPFPKNNFPAPVFAANFEKFNATEIAYKKVYEQKILSQHIDMSHHMNNIEYIKLALNVFNVSELEKCEPLDLEMHYLGESIENQTLSVFYAKVNNASFMKIQDETGRQVFEMKLSFA